MRKSWNRMIALALALAFILALAPQPGAWEAAYAVGSYGRVLKNGTFVRKQPGSDSYWFKLDTGFICTVTDTTSEGGYTWYNIRTSSGLVGFVRGDCASASIGGGSGSGTSGIAPSPADSGLSPVRREPDCPVAGDAPGQALLLSPGPYVSQEACRKFPEGTPCGRTPGLFLSFAGRAGRGPAIRQGEFL